MVFLRRDVHRPPSTHNMAVPAFGVDAMISNLLIIAISLALLVYWFRYTCLLILRTKTSFDYAAEVASANRLSFPEVQTRLSTFRSRPESLDPLHQSLAKDYRLLTYLLAHTTAVNAGGFTLEQRMLMVDFRVMQLWYAMVRRIGIRHAQFALEEMSSILTHFANAMGERAAANMRA